LEEICSKISVIANSNEKEKSIKSFTLMKSILLRTLDPDEKKRNVPLTNSKVIDLIVETIGCVEFLCFVGFTKKSDQLTIPLGKLFEDNVKLLNHELDRMVNNF
jgi:hypothetical protein